MWNSMLYQWDKNKSDPWRLNTTNLNPYKSVNCARTKPLSRASPALANAVLNAICLFFSSTEGDHFANVEGYNFDSLHVRLYTFSQSKRCRLDNKELNFICTFRLLVNVKNHCSGKNTTEFCKGYEIGIQNEGEIPIPYTDLRLETRTSALHTVGAIYALHRLIIIIIIYNNYNI